MPANQGLHTGVSTLVGTDANSARDVQSRVPFEALITYGMPKIEFLCFNKCSSQVAWSK